MSARRFWANNVYRFSSKERHANSGTYYYGYGFYDPNLQRWLNTDPIGEWGGFNLYMVVWNSPLNWHDRFGEKATTIGPITIYWPFTTDSDIEKKRSEFTSGSIRWTGGRAFQAGNRSSERSPRRQRI
jgi:RHS repeat-associated protein